MKNKFSITIFVTCILLVATVFTVTAQDAHEIKISSPYPSLPLSDVKASGNQKTGIVEITMSFKNNYSKSAGVSLAIGGFDDLGITDSKGIKYKVFTQKNAVNTNKGFQNISFVQFGDKKFNWVATVKQEMSAGESRTLTLRMKSENGVKSIGNFHIRCILSLDYEHIGDKMYLIENIPVVWK
ncbi:hypothetical protein [Chitinophaga defluvii]|uniref:Cohesin domain-containing protein n=1 Tax=Chitinophaga defluvii TaxID=3163343 RepID=A0ABV2TCI4_9BACT